MVDVNPNTPPPPPPGEPVSNSPLVQRAMNILTRPRLEWDVIDAEPASVKGLYLRYAVILAAIPALCYLIKGLVFGDGFFGLVTWRSSIGSVIFEAVLMYLLSLLSVAVTAFVVELLAPSFGGQKNRVQAFKAVVYASTAMWVAGVGHLVPWVGGLVLIAGGIYSLYLLFIGVPRLMRPDPGQATTYTIVAIVVALIANLVVLGVTRGVAEAARMTSPGYAENRVATVNVPGVGSVDVRQLEESAKAFERAADAAEKGGQGAVQPVAAERLSALLPATAAGMARGEISSSSGGVSGLEGSQAEAEYAAGERRIRLQVTDMGGAAAFGQLAGAFNVTHSERKGARYEKAGKVNGRMTIEKYDGDSRSGEYTVLVGERFMVEADGDNVSIEDLRNAVNAVGFNRLEALGKAG